MSDRPIGALVAIAVAAPLCLLCLAGPALIATVAGTIVAWFTGTQALVIVGVLLAVAALAWRVVSRRRRPSDEIPSPVTTRQP